MHSIGNGGAVNALFAYVEGVVRGVVSRRYQFAKSGQLVDAVQIISTIPTNPGDSGSPVVNQQGQLVGINNSGDQKAEDISQSIDVTEIHRFLNRCLF